VSRKTASEALFEQFCTDQRVDWKRIPTGAEKTPDYELRVGGHSVLVEIEQIESLVGFEPDGVSSRTVGSHVRHKINAARGQVKVGAERELPTVLLIHNTIDPMQMFGTESHDFISAMYGELTVRLIEGKATGSFHGRNAKMRRDENVSFSAVGHLKRTDRGAEVTLFENVYARYPLPFEVLPLCMGVVRVEIEHAA
jgi:hypothetical protein